MPGGASADGNTEAAPTPAHGPRVLVVEDDAVLQSVLVEVLRDAGYAVHPADDGEQALAYLATTPVDAIVLDLLLPRLDGWAVRAEQRARGLSLDAPLILLSGAHDLAVAASQLGAQAALAKPFDVERVLEVLGQALGNGSPSLEARLEPPVAAVWLLERLHAIPPTNLHTAAQAATQLLAEATGADKVDCFLADGTGWLVAVGTSDTPMGRRQQALGLDRLPVQGGGRVAWVCQTGTPHVDGNVPADPLELEAIKTDLGVRSSLLVPLEVDGRSRGVLALSAAQLNAFTLADLQVVETVARWVGTLAHNAELVERSRLAERRLACMLASVEEAVITTGPDGTIETWNEAAMRLFGYTASEAIGQHAQDLFPAEQAEEAAMLEAVAEGSRTRRLETRRTRKDGTSVHLSASITPVHDDAGTLTGIICIARDVTDRVLQQRALEAERSFLQAVLDSADMGIVACDAHGRLTLFNRATREWHGLPVEPIPAEQWAEYYDLYQPDLRTPLRTDEIPLFRALRDGRVDNAEIAIVPHGQPPRLVLCTGRAVYDGVGQLQGAVVAMLDITARRQAEAERVARERAEAALLAEQQAEARLQLLLAGVRDHAVFLLDPDGRVTTWNAGAERITGYRADEVLGHSFATFFPAAEQARGAPVAELRQAEVEGSFQGEGQRVRKDGSSYWASITLTPLREGEGRLRGFAKVTQDITARRQDQEALQESIERLRTLVANVPGVVYRCANDADWTMTYISEDVEALTGYPASDFLGNRVRSFASLVHPGDADAVWETVQAAIARRQPFTLEYRVQHPDGAWRWVHERGRGVYEPDGQLAWLDGVILDVTARKQAEAELQALAEARALHEAAAQNLADGLAIVDREDRVVFWNPRLEVLSGLPAEQALGRPLADVLSSSPTLIAQSSDPVTAVRQGLEAAERARATRQPVVLDLHTSSGAVRDVVITVFPIYGLDGAYLGHGRLVRDVTKEREVERLKDELVSTVSHELRTPLSSLVGFAELLLYRPYPEETRKQFLSVMLQEGKRLTTLINDFLDLQRLEGGGVVINPRPLDLRPVLQAAVGVAAADTAHPVTLHLPDALPLVLADADRVQQVLANLLSNARKYSPQGGAITLSARPVADGVEVAVTDQGLGIPTEAQPKLFGKFYRVDNSDRREITGTGLGLAICKHIVEAHGGGIRAESPGPGQGSTFAFSLPLAPGVAAAGTPPASLEPPAP